jgi:hypothetical protein
VVLRSRLSDSVAYSFFCPDQAICHCLTGHETSGSTNSASALVPEGRFQLTAGDPKTFTKQHESSNDAHAPLLRRLWQHVVEELQGLVIVEIGTLDDPGELDAPPPKQNCISRTEPNGCPRSRGPRRMPRR